MTFSLGHQGSLGTLLLNGHLTSDSSCHLIDALIASLDSADEIHVQCHNVRSIDISCIHALCSAFRISVRKGKRLHVGGLDQSLFGASPAELKALCSSHSSYGCNRRCLWTPEKLN